MSDPNEGPKHHRWDGYTSPPPHRDVTVMGVKVPPNRVPVDAAKASIDSLREELRSQSTAKASGVTAWLRQWTPQGIVTSLVVLIGALGGAKGVSDIIGSAEKTQAAIEASESRILASIAAAEPARDKRIFDDVERKLRERDVKIAQNSVMIVHLNGGKPEAGWPTRALSVEPLPPEGRFVVTRGGIAYSREPLFTASTPYGELPDRRPFD